MPKLTPESAADLFRREPDRFLDVGAGEVAYRRVGTGPDVLFVHGWPVSGATFRTLLPYLAPHVTCHVIDLPSSGASRFGPDTPLSIAGQIASVRRVLDALALDDLAVVGHDSGGLIARHAVAGDPRLRALCLIDTEQPHRPRLPLRLLLAAGHVPGLGAGLVWSMSRRRLSRTPLGLGGAFADPSLLDDEFDEFFLRPLREHVERRRAAVQLLRTFDMRFVRELPGVHARITVPVQLVWGERDAFFPVAWAREMIGTFPDARLAVVPDAGLFSHEERPAQVANMLLPILTGSH
jgi:pimeloyl-ACP methyl ester carboxylesterase